MALLPILHYPDERLHLIAAPVTKFDAQLCQLIADMQETMYYNNGIGLAASQVNVQQRIFIMDLAKNHETSQLLVFINPQIIAREGEDYHEEGCLSVPGVFERVKRANALSLAYQDTEGRQLSLHCAGLQAICIQHELDHLDGKVFVDYLSALKQNFIKKKMKKLFRNEF